MIFGLLFLFVGHAGIGLTDMHSAWPVVLFAVLASTVVVGNLSPRTVSFLPGMRYYAGNWDTSLWCMKPSAAAKIEQNLVAIPSVPAAQMKKVYGGTKTAALYQYMAYAFRAFNTHGRAMFTLAHHAMAGRDETDYVLTDGELITNTAIGWNWRRPYVQRATHRRTARPVRLRTRRGAGRTARRPAHPAPNPALPTRRRRDRRIRERLRPRRRHGQQPAVGRHHSRLRRRTRHTKLEHVPKSTC